METFRPTNEVNIRYSPEKQEVYRVLSDFLHRIQYEIGKKDPLGEEHGRGLCVNICIYLSDPSEQDLHQLSIMGINPETLKEIRDISRFIEMTGESQEEIKDLIHNIIQHLSHKLCEALEKSSAIRKNIHNLL